MKKISTQLTIVTGFAIFTMLFGAGNFILPPKLGVIAGDRTVMAVLAFIVTAVILPILGLMCSFLFEGDYRAFFYRLGTIPGSLLIALCMLIIGPGLVMPRIINLCYEMLHPFIPGMSLLAFSLAFCTLTFSLTYKPSRLIDILGYIITPLKLSFVALLVIVGIITGNAALTTEIPTTKLIVESLLYGYNTLDLLGTVFFGSVIIDIFKRSLNLPKNYPAKSLIFNGLISSVIGATILAVAYFGMSFLGTYHGANLNLQGINEAQALSAISLQVLGNKGGFFGACALLIACLATMIALSTVVAEYIQKELLLEIVSFPISLAFMLAITIVISLLGLTSLMNFSAMLTQVLYPILVTLTICNMAYKLFGFKPVKLPVLIVFAVSLFMTLKGMGLLQ